MKPSVGHFSKRACFCATALAGMTFSLVLSFIISEISSFPLLIGRKDIFLRSNFVVCAPDWLRMLFSMIFEGKS